MHDTIYLVCGPSGSGKSAIIDYLCSNYGFVELKSYTTRPKRFEAENTHTFISNAEFDKLTDICAYTDYGNNRYCATTEQVNNSDFYAIGPSGIEYFKNNYNGDNNVKVIYIYTSIVIRFLRMIKRGDSLCNVIKRLIIDSKEFKHKKDSSDIIINNNKSGLVIPALEILECLK